MPETDHILPNIHADGGARTGADALVGQRMRSAAHPETPRLPRALLRIGLAILLVPGLSGCDKADDARKVVGGAASSMSETLHSVTTPGPATVLHRMLLRAESGDWRGYLDFYGESEKLRTEADRHALAHRFQTEWGHRVLATLQRADAVTPVIEGDRAVFSDDRGEIFVLYRGQDGQWGFHL